MNWIWKTSLVYILLLVGFICIFYAPELFGGRVLYCCDNFLLTIPAKVFWNTWYARGFFPLWNPLLLSGTPFVADINLSPLYFGNWAYLLFVPFRAVTVLVITHALFGSFGVFVLGRQFGLTRWGSFIAALVFGGSGTIATYSGNVPMAQVAGWIPWLLWSARRYCTFPTSKSLLLFLGITANILLAGHPQLVFYGLVLMAAYVFMFSGTPKFVLQRFAIVTPFIVALSAIQLFPFVEMAMLSTRTGFGAEYTVFGSLPPWALIRLVIPLVVGSSSTGTAWWQGGSVYGYIGSVALFVTLLGYKREKRVIFLTLVAIVSLVLAFGSYIPFSAFMLQHIPGISSFRVPAHFLLPYTLALSLLVGITAEYLVNGGKPRFSAMYIVWLGVLGTVSGGLAWLARLGAGEFISHSDFLPTKVAGKLLVLEETGLIRILSGISICFLITGGSLLVIADLYRMKKIGWLKIILPVILGLELLLFSRGGIISAGEREVTSWFAVSDATAAQLKEYLGNNTRLYSEPNLDSIPVQTPFGEPSFERESYWQVYFLRSNLAALYGIPSVQGYASMVYAPYQQFYGMRASDPTGVSIPVHNTRLLGEASSRVMLRRASGMCAWIAGESPPLSCIQIELNADVKPRISFSDSAAQILSQSELPGYVRLVVKTTASTQILFREVDFPGWQVYLDGKPVNHGKYAGIFQTVSIPAGQHAITFIFSPLSIRLGTAVSLLGLIVYCWFFMRYLSVSK